MSNNNNNKEVLKAMILVGGFGTRLRPLTFSTPKPLVPFCNKPMIAHQIEALKNVGVSEVVLAVNYKPKEMEKEMKKFEKLYDLKISYSLEEVPLGTAGPLKLAEKLLTSNNCSNFFVLNSDITCEYPLKDLLKFHKSHGKEGTIMVTKVTDPSKYGVVVSDPKSSKIEKFVEKPKIFVGDRINAGIYIFNKKILNRIELKPTSIERVIFPKMAQDGQLYSMDLKGFWMDIGQPKDFLTGMTLYLNYLKNNNNKTILYQKNKDDKFKILDETVIIAKSAKIGNNCLIGPNVVIGENVEIKDNSRITRSVLLNDSKIGQSTWIHSSIIGWNSIIGDWVRTKNNCVIGEDVKVSNDLILNGGRILPHKGIKNDITDPNQIIM